MANNQRLTGHIGFLDALRPVSGPDTVDGNASFSRHDGEEILGRQQPGRAETVAAR